MKQSFDFYYPILEKLLEDFDFIDELVIVFPINLKLFHLKLPFYIFQQYQILLL